MIGMFKETKGFIGDLCDVIKQKIGIKTPEVILGREILTAFAEIIERINPLNTFISIAHSGGGSWIQGALNCMNTEQKERIKNMILSIGIAPASCISNEVALRSTNFYSKGDLYTGIFGVVSTPGFRTAAFGLSSTPAFRGMCGFVGTTWFRSTYNVTFLDSSRSVSQGIDHSILYPTQQGAIQQEFKELEDKYGFHKKAR